VIPESLTALLASLDASDTALKRDVIPRGDHAIHGKAGHIYPDGAGYLLYVSAGESTVKWKHLKHRLSFCRVKQDGDAEGCLHLYHLPTADQAAAIRKALGIRQRRHITAEQSASLAGRLSIARENRLSKTPFLAPPIAPFEQGATPIAATLQSTC
jgi:hypothetical protein